MYHEKIREDIIDGFGPWFWPYADDGAWDGPANDWKTHKPTIEVLKNRRCAIQAGGCCGMYPKLLSKMFEHVVTFEPEPQNFHFLNKNLAGVENVLALNFALGNTNGPVSLEIAHPSNVGMHRVVDAGEHVVQMRSLDLLSYFTDEHFIDLIWFDLEGYELNALKGAEQTIRKHRPMIGVERADDNVINFLAGLEYSKFSVSEMDTFFLPNEFVR